MIKESVKKAEEKGRKRTQEEQECGDRDGDAEINRMEIWVEASVAEVKAEGLKEDLSEDSGRFDVEYEMQEAWDDVHGATCL